MVMPLRPIWKPGMLISSADVQGNAERWSAPVSETSMLLMRVSDLKPLTSLSGTTVQLDQILSLSTTALFPATLLHSPK